VNPSGLFHTPYRKHLFQGAVTTTSSRVVACSRPARGPESKVAVAAIGPGGWAEGTRTEARQNVPQAKPEVVVSPIVRAPAASETRADGPSWLPTAA
jgi:hypothetical protein